MALFTLDTKSRCLHTPTEVKVLLPDVPMGTKPSDHYLSGKKFKALWLLHGANSEPNDWLMKTNIARYVRYYDIMVVMPTALNSFYSNYTTFSDGFNYWDYMNEELMPMIQGWFPASTEPADNYLGGFSMGGAGTIMWGCAHPEKFGGLIVLSSALRDVEWLRPHRDLTSAEFRARASADRNAFPGIHGAITDSEINAIAKYLTVGGYLDSCENTWDRFTETVKAGKLPKMYVGCGTLDRAYPRFLKFKEYAGQLGADVTFEAAEGYDHELEYWDIGIKRALEFFGLCKDLR